MTDKLFGRVGELDAISALLLHLAGVGSDRLSLSQAAFFMLAATADAAGKPASRIELVTANENAFRGSIRNSYRQLMPPSRLYPNALGWLEAEVDPMDSRQHFLKLTDKGRDVVEAALAAARPNERFHSGR